MTPEMATKQSYADALGSSAQAVRDRETTLLACLDRITGIIQQKAGMLTELEVSYKGHLLKKDAHNGKRVVCLTGPGYTTYQGINGGTYYNHRYANNFDYWQSPAPYQTFIDYANYRGLTKASYQEQVDIAAVLPVLLTKLLMKIDITISETEAAAASTELLRANGYYELACWESSRGPIDPINTEKKRPSARKARVAALYRLATGCVLSVVISLCWPSIAKYALPAVLIWVVVEYCVHCNAYSYGGSGDDGCGVYGMH